MRILAPRRRRCQKRAQRPPRIRPGHQMLPDEKSIEARTLQPLEIVMRTDPRLADGDAILRNRFHKLKGSFQAYVKCREVAVVHSDDARPRADRPRKLRAVMHLDHRLHPQIPPELPESAQ